MAKPEYWFSVSSAKTFAAEKMKTIRQSSDLLSMEIVITEPHRRSNPLLDRISLVQGSIADQDVDAIVSFVPDSLKYYGEMNTAIHKVAGKELDQYILDNITNPKPGDVYAVPGFNMPCEHILFAVTPDWRSDFEREDRHLLDCCRKAIALAQSMSLDRIAIPPLAAGKHGFPRQRAARLIVQEIEAQLDEDIQEIRITCLHDAMIDIFEQRLKAIGWVG